MFLPEPVGEAGLGGSSSSIVDLAAGLDGSLSSFSIGKSPIEDTLESTWAVSLVSCRPNAEFFRGLDPLLSCLLIVVDPLLFGEEGSFAALASFIAFILEAISELAFARDGEALPFSGETADSRATCMAFILAAILAFPLAGLPVPVSAMGDPLALPVSPLAL